MHNDVMTILEDARIKPTTQRITILEYLLGNHTHPSSEQIFQDLHNEENSLSRATVYNTLNIFKDKGLVRAVDTGDEVLHYDIQLNDHGHFQCESCKEIWNIELPASEKTISGLPADFVATEYLVLVKGYCSDCRPNGETN